MTARKPVLRSNLRKSLIPPLVLILLACCQQSGKKDTLAATEKEHTNRQTAIHLNHQRVPQELLTLTGQGQEKEEIAGKDNLLKKNLYGKFFHDRAEFYIIQEPQNRLYHAKVKSLTLYI